MDTKDYVIARVQTTAEWRRDKARQYPGDRRNRDTAEALEELARELAALPAEEFQKLDELQTRAGETGDRLSDISEAEDQLLGRYGGNDRGSGDARDFLKDLCEIYEGEEA